MHLCLFSFILYIFYLAGDSFCQCLLLCLNKKNWLWMSPVFFHLFGSHFKSRLFQTPTLSFSYLFQFFFKLQFPHTLARQISVLNEPCKNVPSKAAVFRLLQLPINWCNWSSHWAQKGSKIRLTQVICVTLSIWTPTLILVKWLNMTLPPSSQPCSSGGFAVGSLWRGHNPKKLLVFSQ